jgi:hypothetical protein
MGILFANYDVLIPERGEKREGGWPAIEPQRWTSFQPAGFITPRLGSNKLKAHSPWLMATVAIL